MFRALVSVTVVTFGLTVLALAQPAAPKEVEAKPTASRVVAVTLYQNTAMVTREVTVPEALGVSEVIVTSLPPETISSTLYSEAADGVRVLSTRFRSRPIATDNREEVRRIEAQIKELAAKLQTLQAELATSEQNAQLLTKLEGFTAATLTSLTEKGQLDSEKTIALATYIQETREKRSKADVLLKQQIATVQADMNFAQRKLNEVSGGVVRTEYDAVIVVDKTKPGAATVRLNYLVSNASWKPNYKLRAGTKDTDKIAVEYLASVQQRTGEDWKNVSLTLSTAQPLLNAAPPDLLALEVTTGPAGQMMGMGGGDFYGGFGGGGIQGGFAGGIPGPSGAPNQPGKPQAEKDRASMPSASTYLKGLEEQSKQLRQQAQENLNRREAKVGGKLSNDAAAIDQYRDLFVSREEVVNAAEFDINDMASAPSVTFRLKDKISLPSRTEEQVLEVAKLELMPQFHYKAVPVLTQQVFRIAELKNTSEMILLPGEATTYLGSDFVGQTRLPLVAIGKPFTVGFGVDAQLQISRKLMDKTQTTQGGNQVLTFKYRTLLSSYKANAVDVQVWDRMPHAEATQTIAVTLSKTEPALSTNTLYLRDERPRNLLRWDVKVEPKQNGDQSLNIEYEYKIEYARDVMIGSFLAK